MGEIGGFPERDRGKKNGEQLRAGLERPKSQYVDLEPCKAAYGEDIFTSGDCARILLHSTDAAIALYQGERFIYANPAMERLTGYSKEEMYRMSFVHWLRSDSKELVKKITRERLNGLPAPERYEIVFVRKNGEERWVQITAGKFTYDGKPTGLITAIDITERRRSEESLRLVQSFVDRARDMAFFISHSGQFIYVNEAACNALGYTREELLDMCTYDLNPEHTGEKWGEYWNEIKKLGDLTFDTTLMASDGAGIPVEISSKYLTFDDHGYVCSFVRDITERKKADDALKNAKAQAELYVDLMGHDINNMNQAAMGYLELAEDRMETEGKLDPDDRQLISKPLDVLRNASRLIDNVRKVQKEKAGAYKPEMIDVDKMLSDVLAQYSQVAGREVSINYTPSATCVVSANELLKDVFINLIGNAIKHSAGPLAINVIFDSIIEDGQKYCRVAVEDNGPGIPDELKKRLFDRLTLTATRASGKGFGLCLIKMLIDDFHGQFWMEDRVPGDHSQGSRFMIMLPAVE